VGRTTIPTYANRSVADMNLDENTDYSAQNCATRYISSFDRMHNGMGAHRGAGDGACGKTSLLNVFTRG